MKPGDDLSYHELVYELTAEADALSRLNGPQFCVTGSEVSRRLAALPEGDRLRVARSAYRALVVLKLPQLLKHEDQTDR